MAAATNNGRSEKAVDETPKVTKQDWDRDNGKDLIERPLSQRPFKKIRRLHVSLVSSVPPTSITLLHSSPTMPSSGLKEDRTLARPQVPPINTTKVYRGVKRPHSGKLEVEICIPRNMTRLWLNEAALAYNYAACKLRGKYALLNFSFLYKDIAVSTAPRILLSSLPMLHENLFPHWSSKQPQQTLKCLNLQASNMEVMPPPPLGDNTSENSGLGLHDADANDEFQAIATRPGTGDGVVESKESEWEAWYSILVGWDAGRPIRDYTWPWPPLLPCGDNPDDDLGLGLREATASEEVQAIETLAGRGAGEGADESVWGDWLNADLAGWGTGSPVWGYMPSTPFLKSSISKRKRKEVAKEKKETEKKQNEVENQEEEEELLNKRLRRVVVFIEKEEGKESTEESKEEEKGKYQDTEKSTKRPLEDFEPSTFAEADFQLMTRFDLNQASGIIVLNFPEPVIPMPFLFSVYELLSIFTQTYICNPLIGPQEVEPQYKKHLDMDQAGDKIMRDLIAQIHSPPSMKEPPISTRAQGVKPILAKDDLDTLFARMEVAVSSATVTSTSHTGSGVVEQTSGGTEEIEQAKAVPERCLALEFSQILESKIKAQFILALSVLSSATSEFSSAQIESIHQLWGQFHTLTLNLHHSQKEFAECNKFLDRKDVLYDEHKKFIDSNSTIMAQLQKLSAEKERLMAKLTEIEATEAKFIENKKQLGKQAKTTVANWKQLKSDSAEMKMRKKIAEDNILQVSMVWSKFKVFFPLVETGS